jgi:hypothetical protein
MPVQRDWHPGRRWGNLPVARPLSVEPRLGVFGNGALVSLLFLLTIERATLADTCFCSSLSVVCSSLLLKVYKPVGAEGEGGEG